MSPLQVAKAYAAAQKAAGGASSPRPAGDEGDFSAMLRQAMGDAIQVSKHAEFQMSNQAKGKGELVDVVTAVAQAEVSLESVVSIRDQMISAYQEIMRMPI